MAKRRVRKAKEDTKCRCCSSFFKILIVILAILIVLALLYSSGLMGNSVSAICKDTDTTAVDKLGNIITNDASLWKSGSVSSEGTTVEDYCDGASIVEFFCDNGHRDSERIVCSRGCLNAACKP